MGKDYIFKCQKKALWELDPYLLYISVNPINKRTFSISLEFDWVGEKGEKIWGWDGEMHRPIENGRFQITKKAKKGVWEPLEQGRKKT